MNLAGIEKQPHPFSFDVTNVEALLVPLCDITKGEVGGVPRRPILTSTVLGTQTSTGSESWALSHF